MKQKTNIKSNSKYKKLKLISLSAVLAISSATAIVVSSCGPSAEAIKQLFPASSSLGFANFSSNSTTQDIMTRSLSDPTGFNAFLTSKLSDVLETWYKNNPNSSVKSRYNNFVDVVEDDYKKLVKELKETHGADYIVELQKTYFDEHGGTEESYKKSQLQEKIFNDFTSEMFNELFLKYVDNNQIIIPTSDDLKSEANWYKIQFTNSVNGYVASNLSDINNVNQMYAQMQNAIFDRWVKEENPNFLSSVSINNGLPHNNSLDLIFNKDIIGTDNLTESYSFQVVENNLNQPANTKGTAAYKIMVGDSQGLSKYVGTNGEIDFPRELSGSDVTKTLMTASQMFGETDVTIPAAYVEQYLSLIGDTDRDNVGAAVELSGSSSTTSATDKDFNIMNNFIRTIPQNPSGGNADPDSAFSAIDTSFTNVNTTINDTFYDSYKELSKNNNTTHGIYNIAKPKASTTGTDDKNKYFTLVRTSTGINIMGIDGGSYYLSSTTSGSSTQNRDITKQEKFLKFRAMYASSISSTDPYAYQFDLKSGLSTWFEENKPEILYTVLKDALDKSNTFSESSPSTKDTTDTINNFFDLSSNAEFKTDFQNLKNEIDTYVTKFSDYQLASKLQTNINTVNEKVNAWAKTYSDMEANFTPEKVGIAAKLPYVCQADGNYYGLNQYYLNEYSFTTTQAGEPTKTDSISKINENLNEKLVALNTEAKNLVTKFEIKLQDKSKTQYAQVLFVNSKDANYDLAFNKSLQSNIANSNVTNLIKDQYFQNNSNFKNIFNAIEGTTTNGTTTQKVYDIDNETLKTLVNTYYWMPQWYSASNRLSFGNFTNETTLDKIIQSYKSLQYSNNILRDSTISYYTYLYTLDWLLRDNLANFKSILSKIIIEGTNAAITWTMNANPDNINGSSATNDPITVFPTNPNFLQGSNTNWFNFVDPTGSGGSSDVPPTVDTFNDTANPYYYTNTNITSNSTTTATKLYGFDGITLENSSGIDSNVSAQLFASYGNTGTKGSLSAYQSKEELLKYLERINTLYELDQLASTLESRARVELSAYYQKDKNGNSVLDFNGKKALLKTKIDGLDNNGSEYFAKFEGFVGNKKVESQLLTTSSSDRLSKVKESEPVIESGNQRLTRVVAFAKQINYQDVKQLGGESWSTDSTTSSSDKRLGLDLNTFLAIVALQASESTTQSLAIYDLTNSNTIQDSNKTKFTTGDKRLYDALGVAWLNKPENN